MSTTITVGYIDADGREYEIEAEGSGKWVSGTFRNPPESPEFEVTKVERYEGDRPPRDLVEIDLDSEEGRAWWDVNGEAVLDEVADRAWHCATRGW